MMATGAIALFCRLSVSSNFSCNFLIFVNCFCSYEMYSKKDVEFYFS